MHPWGRALLGLALTCAAAVGLLSLGPTAPVPPVAVAIALIVPGADAPVPAGGTLRVAPKTSPPVA